MSELERQAVTRVLDKARELGVQIPIELQRAEARLAHGNQFDGHTRWKELHPGQDIPDDALGCCYGTAVQGDEFCNCWEPVFDVDQADPIPLTDPSQLRAQPRMCSDCAYRHDSPERADEYMAETLMDLTNGNVPFWCHDGMRRPIAYRHPVLGEVPGSSDDWQPAMLGSVPYRADGRPGLLCAGWAQRRARIMDELREIG